MDQAKRMENTKAQMCAFGPFLGPGSTQKNNTKMDRNEPRLFNVRVCRGIFHTDVGHDRAVERLIAYSTTHRELEGRHFCRIQLHTGCFAKRESVQDWNGITNPRSFGKNCKVSRRLLLMGVASAY